MKSINRVFAVSVLALFAGALFISSSAWAEDPILPPAPIVATEKCNCFTFDATKSFDVDGDKLTVLWDMGDGQTSDKPVLTHCYEKVGPYDVSLTVRDSSGQICDSGVTSTKVFVSFPAKAITGPDQETCLGQSLSFDASQSLSNGPATYTWDFGDGQTAQGAKVDHTYERAGHYKVLLTVNDNKNTECSIARTSTSAHIYQNAAVTLTGASAACVGKTVTFDAQGSGEPLKYRWEFGDGEVWEGGPIASHAYQKAGDYTVSVTVDDGRGSTCSTASSSAKIRINEPPIARIAEITSCLVNEPVQFDGSASQGMNLSYNWNFGDGETGEGARISHTYRKAGNYRIVLTVKDSSGGECSLSSSSVVAKVNNRPEAVIQVR